MNSGGNCSLRFRSFELFKFFRCSTSRQSLPQSIQSNFWRPKRCECKDFVDERLKYFLNDNDIIDIQPPPSLGSRDSFRCMEFSARKHRSFQLRNSFMDPRIGRQNILYAHLIPWTKDCCRSKSGSSHGLWKKLLRRSSSGEPSINFDL